MHELIDITELASRLDEVTARLREGERIVLTRGGVPVGAVVSLAELNDLDETDAVLADEGLLDALREARAASEEPSTYET